MNDMDIQDLSQLRQIEEMKRQILNKILTKEAFERLSRVKIVNPQLANQAELYLIQIFQAGKINDPIGDGKLKGVLRVLSEKKEMRIRRK